MNTREKKWISAAVAGVSAMMTASTPADVLYRITDLGTLGTSPSRAWGIDEVGRIVGESSVRLDEEHLHGFLWNGAIVDLGAQPGWPHSIAFALNKAGQVVGPSFRLGDMNDAATRWAEGVIEPLGAFTPRALNSDCVVAGVRYVDDGAGLWMEQAVRWENGALTPLPTLGGQNAWAAAINDAGWVVGASQMPDEATVRAALWLDNAVFDLGTLGGDSSQALAVNASGYVVGWSDAADGTQHAFLFEVDSGGNVTARRDLGELGGGTSYAFSLNASGDVVGSSDDAAFLWTMGEMIDLNTRIDPLSGWTLKDAVAINDAGQIAGRGTVEGEFHAYLLTPGDSVDCTRIRKLTARCVDGKLTAKVVSSLPEGTVLTLTRNGGDAKTLTINARGRGKVKWTKQSGSQMVRVVECPETATPVSCL
ncbi:MAG: hypothetical protein FLDDKLPJ_02474 [Phycisphaerae bacterium]|nr:hypothetical protein [Phycisphaerae bacterium]